MSTTIITTIKSLLEIVITYLPKLIFALATLWFGLRSHIIIDYWLEKIFQQQKIDESLQNFLQSLVRLGYKLVVIFLAVSIAGLETTSIIAIFGAAGFAVGLALQGSMSNFASGILILSLKPIKINEYIKVGEFSGTVKNIEIFNTILITPDNKTVIIPNVKITSQVLVNYSRQKLRRLELKVRVDHKVKIKTVEDIIAAIINSSKFIATDTNKENIIGISQLTDSAIIFDVKVWCQANNLVKLRYELLSKIKQTFKKAKIDNPTETITIKSNNRS